MLNLVAAIIDIHGARSALWYNVTTFLNPEVLGTTLQVLFVICTPSLAVWLLLQRAYLKSRSDILLSIKMLLASAVWGCRLYEHNMRFEISSLRRWPYYDVEPSAVAMVESACITWLLYLNHIYGIQPISAISVYLAIAITIHGAGWWLESHSSQTTISSSQAKFLGRLVLLILHEIPKWHLLPRHWQKIVGLQSTFGLFGRSTAIWLCPTLASGFWTSLTMSDLSGLPRELLMRGILSRFGQLWSSCRLLPNGLAKACTLISLKSVIVSSIARLIVTIGKLSIPYLAQQVVNFQAIQTHPNEASWSKHDLLLMTLFIFTALASFNGCALHYQARTATILQGALSGSIFSKLLDLSDSDITDSVSFSLFTGDVPEAMQLIRRFQDTVFYSIEASVPLVMIWPYLGLLSFIPCAILIGASKLANIPTEKLPGIRQELEEKRQAREDQVNNTLYKLKEIKMTEREPILHKILKEMRETEMESYEEFHTQQAYRFAITGSCSIFAPVISLYARSTPSLDTTESTFANILKCFALLFLSSLSYDLALASYWQCNRSLDCMSSISRFLNIETKDFSQLNTGVAKTVTGPVVQLDEAFIAPKRDIPPVLKDVTLSLQQGTISIITGKPATGKSTFAKSLIRDSHVSQGTVVVRATSVGFCGQRSWLQHRSIKSNIIGPAKIDEIWYNKVKAACNLDQDISQYPGDDQYVIGEDARQLNEAQSQKIALARAIYARPPLLVLDDAFANIDRFATESILNRLFGHNGLLINGTTVVITATDPAPFCNVVNQFYRLDDDGRMLWMERSQVILEAKRRREHSMSVPEIIDQDVVKVHPKALPKDATLQPLQLPTIGLSIDKAPLSFYFHYVKKDMVYLFGISVSLLALMEFSFPILASMGYYSGNLTRPVVLFTALCALLYGLVAAFTGFHFYVGIASNVSKDMHNDLLNAVSRSHLLLLTPRQTTRIVRLFNEGMRVLTHDLPHGILQSFYRLVMVAIVCALLVRADYTIFLALPGVGMLAYMMKRIYYPTSTQLHHMQLASRASLHAHFTEAVAGTGYVRTFQWKDGYLAGILGTINRQQKVFYYKTSLDQCLHVVVDGLVTIVVVFFLYKVLGTDASPAMVGSAFVGCLYIQPELKEAFGAWFLMDDGRTTIEEMRQIIQLEPEEVLKQEAVVPENWPSAGLIELKDVTIWYNRNEAPVLENITITMHDKSEIGLFGRPQTGKTALFLTFLNQLPYTGSITIDGVEVRTIPREKLAEIITVVPQEFIIFPGTVRQNLIPDEFFNPPEITVQPVEDGEEDETEEVEAYTFIMQRILYRLGLLDIINAAGGLGADIALVSMSTEQKHRFSLGQALTTFFLRQTKITLVDDLTSKVGHGDCVIMRQAIRELMGDVTAVAVAHHPSAIIGSDAIGEIKDNSASMRKRVIMQGDSDDEEAPGNRAFLPTAYPIPKIDPTLPQNQPQSQPRKAGRSHGQTKPQRRSAVAGPSEPRKQLQQRPVVASSTLAPPQPPVPSPTPSQKQALEHQSGDESALSDRQTQKLPFSSLRKDVSETQPTNPNSTVASKESKRESSEAPAVAPPKDQPTKAGVDHTTSPSSPE